jgi:PRC-barrel domain
MLQSIKQFYGNKLGAFDGDLGHMKDFYFDDRNWAIRYVVADTGNWLTGRQVLISPYAFDGVDRTEKILRVKLTRKEIENSPAIETHKPVSRQYEEEYHHYYGWPYYWQGDALWGMSDVPLLELSANPLPSAPPVATERGDAHLRSTQAVNGYQVRTANEIIGHICDFMMDDQNWAISELVIKTGHRFTGKEERMPVSQVDRISYEGSTVFVNSIAEAVEQSPAHHLTVG